jgi:hypothetical protein
MQSAGEKKSLKKEKEKEKERNDYQRNKFIYLTTLKNEMRCKEKESCIKEV